MSSPGTNAFTTGGAISYGWFDNRKAGVIKERVTGTGQLPSLTLTNVLPANSRLIMAAMKNPTAVNIYLGSSASATAGQAGVALVIGTAPTALTTSLTTGNYASLPLQTSFGSAIPKNSVSANAWDTLAASTNGLLLATAINSYANLQFTATQPISLVPYMGTATATQAKQVFTVATGTAPTVATTGYTFGTGTSDTYSFDVEVFFETFTTPPNN